VPSLVEAPAVVAFSVTDTGIGVNDEQQQRIFEAFAQGDGSTSRIYGGTGLGLSISRELVGLLEGEIRVRSTLGEGTTFFVFLPAELPSTKETSTAVHFGSPLSTTSEPPPARVAARQRLQEDSRQSRDQIRSDLADYPQFKDLHVLVVDDDPTNTFAMTTLLERGNARVTCVDSGAEAIATLGSLPDIDLVLMDIMMPVMNGYEAIRAIRSIARFRKLPIVAVTAKEEQGERERCLEAGANGYVPKPVLTADFITAVESSLAPQTEEVAAVRVAEEAAGEVAEVAATSGGRAAQSKRQNAGLGTAPAFSIEGVKILVVDDDFRNIFAMTALLERVHATVSVAESGAEAIATLQRESDVRIVLMDIMMPVMDGYQAMRNIRATGRFDSLPIIAVTGKASAGERQRCLDAGANDYIPKPVESAELLAALRPWLPIPEQVV
jgi:CheY-like chemotaxis protein